MLLAPYFLHCRRADDQEMLADELLSAAEVMRMHDAAGELLDPIEVRHVRYREVASRDDHVVELLAEHPIEREILGHHGEFAAPLVVADRTDGGGEADMLADIALAGTTCDVVGERGTWRK